MIKMKSFTTPIKIFATIRELTELDETVRPVPRRREGDDRLFGERLDDRRRHRRDHRPDQGGRLRGVARPLPAS